MEWIAKKYDSFQKEYQFKNGLELLSWLEDIIPLENKAILDLGCGNGDLSLVLKERVGEQGIVVALDQDSGMLAIFRKKAKSETIRIELSGIESWLASNEEFFDVIFSNAMLHWLPSLEKFEMVLSSCFRHLNKGGLLAFRFSLEKNGLAAKNFLAQTLKDFTQNPDLILSHSCLNYKECTTLFQKSGFSLIKAQEKYFEPFPNPEMSYQWMISSQPLLKFLEKSDLANFQRKLKEQWSSTPIEVKSHHGLFLAQKIDS